MLTKEQILSTPTPKLTPIPVPEWGGEVCVKVMSGTERDAWEAVAFEDGHVTKDQFRAKLLVQTLSDEDGNLLFTPADIAALNEQASPVLIRLGDIALEVNALNAKDVDKLTKN